MEWNNGILSKAVIKANYDSPCRLRTKTPVKIFVAGKEIEVKMLEDNLVEFETKKDETVEIIRN
jgi:hypothetical protein